MNYDICLICLDNIDNKDKIMTNCNCKIKLHISCLELIKQHNMLCPICRIKTKNNITINNSNNITINSSNNYLSDSLIIIKLIFATITSIFFISYGYFAWYFYYMYFMVPIYTCYIIHVFYRPYTILHP
jgi:hypothetical protein